MLPLLILALALLPTPDGPDRQRGDTTTAFVGATVWPGGDAAPIPDAVLIVRDGRVVSLGASGAMDIPAGARVVDLAGRFVVPGLINAHGHVGMARGLETGPAAHSEQNVRDQLRLYAQYGVTTVVSLGDEPPHAFTVRDRADPANPRMARLALAGDVVHGFDEDDVREQVRQRGEEGADWTKIRVDDGLGTREKMPERVYAAVIDESHRHGIPHASHMVTLEDARGLIRHGADVLAHSVRDAPVDDDLIQAMLAGDHCITPTLTRELSTFIYAERPDFFDDPFFLQHADPAVLEELQQPDVQQRFTGPAADYYRQALPLAIANMLRLHEAGVRVAMGTDSGPPARFQGYFEHLEMAMMQDAGMAPLAVLRSATDVAAACMHLEHVGTLTPGSWADFLVTDADPLADVRHLRQIHAVYLAGLPLD
jgi:imidazolonepropionase-like amidohydrolase